MKRLRFTIGELILLVTVVAIGLAAVVSASAAWAGSMLSITFFAMIASVLGVVWGRGMRRVYWSGFALLGWSYLFLMYVPTLRIHVGHRLLAPKLFPYLAEVLHVEGQGGSNGGLQSVSVALLATWTSAGGFGGGAASVDLEDFVQIGTAIEALLWAFLGGWVACYFASGPDQERRPALAAGDASVEPSERRGPDNTTTRSANPPS
jgi:hypothetical protein